MKYRKMGRHGIRLSDISLGAWLTYGGSVENDMAKQCILKALEEGVNFIDIADIYAKGKAESVVGEIINNATYARKDLVISSKVFWPMTDNVNDVGLSRKHIMDSIDNTLDRLGMDYLDIYFCHRYDWDTPLEETIGAMDDLVRDGRVRYWGTSVWSAAQLERAVGVAKEMGAKLPAVEQPRYNMIDRTIELEIMHTTKHHGMGIVPWSPLGGGLLTGKYNDGIPAGSRAEQNEWMKKSITDDTIGKLRKLSDVAKVADLSLGQLALAWILRRDEISSVITGATKVSHVEDNLAASGVTLSNDIIGQIDEILDNTPTWPSVYTPSLVNR